MLARSALLIALFAAASQPLAAGPAAAQSERTFSTASITLDETVARAPAAAEPRQAQPADSEEAHVLALQPNVAAPGDIVGGHGPSVHSRELREIALAADLGDNDRVDMLTKQVRKFGVTREAIQHYQDRVRLHGDGSRTLPQSQQFGSSQAAPERAVWDMTQ